MIFWPIFDRARGPPGQKWRFSIFTKLCHVGTLNLCQKMPDKMQKELSHLDHTILRKRPKCGQNWPIYPFLGHFGRFLRIEWLKWPNSFCILSGIFWHKFRVPTWGSLVKIENHHFWPGRPLAQTNLRQKILFTAKTFFRKLI